jgi:ankyrin repeat protein
MARFLLDRGADVNAPGTDETTPLHCAAGSGQTSMVEFLLSRGANVNAKAAYDLTPLHSAAYGGHTLAAKVLLNHGADISAKSNGWTPLQCSKSGEFSELLRKKGAAE